MKHLKNLLEVNSTFRFFIYRVLVNIMMRAGDQSINNEDCMSFRENNAIHMVLLPIHDI